MPVREMPVHCSNRDLAVELPFTLTHPKPPPTPSPSRQLDLMSNPLHSDGLQAGDVPVDLNLIQLDAKFDISPRPFDRSIERMFLCLVSMELVKTMISSLKNSLEYVSKATKRVSTIQKRNGGLSLPTTRTKICHLNLFIILAMRLRSDLVFVNTYRCLMSRSSRLFVITEKNIKK